MVANGNRFRKPLKTWPKACVPNTVFILKDTLVLVVFQKSTKKQLAKHFGRKRLIKIKRGMSKVTCIILKSGYFILKICAKTSTCWMQWTLHEISFNYKLEINAYSPKSSTHTFYRSTDLFFFLPYWFYTVSEQRTCISDVTWPNQSSWPKNEKWKI